MSSYPGNRSTLFLSNRHNQKKKKTQNRQRRKYNATCRCFHPPFNLLAGDAPRYFPFGASAYKAVEDARRQH